MESTTPRATPPILAGDAAGERFAREIDAIADEVRNDLGPRDEAYLRRLLALQRRTALAGRLLILASVFFLPDWRHALAATPVFLAVIGLGTATLALAKILDNMEIGHHVMHGQWDWLNDPAIQSATWEWDNVCPSALWKHSHNLIHHTWTNVIGLDRDLGYGPLRVAVQQRWHPGHLGQPLYAALLALLFEWGLALHDVRLSRIRKREVPAAAAWDQLRQIGRKARRQLGKDYLLWPLLAGPFFLHVLAANLAANLIRNLWSFVIIFCGHFPAGVSVFTQEEVRDETRARRCVRQVVGSCNITGGPLFHILSGNLGHQIEHHLFPWMPSSRYAEVAPRVQAICARHGVPYNSGSLARQFGTTTLKLLRLSLP